MGERMGDTVGMRVHIAEQDVERARESIAYAQRQLESAMRERTEAEARLEYWRSVRALVEHV